MQQYKYQSPLALAYAQAMLDLANEAKNADGIRQELRDLRQLVDNNPQFAQVLSDPAIGDDERAQFIHRVFDGKASKLIMEFLGLLNEKGRLGRLREIASAYDDLLEQQQGKIEVDVTVAHKLGDDQLESVRKTVSDALKRKAVVKQQVDESIIGGIVLQVQDQLIDGSVRAQLAAMRHTLLASRPR